MSGAALRADVAGHVATVTLLGPGKGNTMGPDFWRELPVVFRALDSEPAVRAVVIADSGGQFSYGLDLDAMLPAWADVLDPGAQAGSHGLIPLLSHG